MTQVGTTSAEARAGGEGVCQDFAHVALALLRAAGLPARYVSGYFYPEREASPRRACARREPRVGRVLGGRLGAADPSNLSEVADRHVLVARGRDYADVRPAGRHLLRSARWPGARRHGRADPPALIASPLLPKIGCPGQVATCAKFRDRPTSAVHEQATRAAMRSRAQRVQLLDAEIDLHDRALRELLDDATPQLLAERGIGYITAAQFYLAWSHPGRCHSEAAFARLGGTSPVPATSGQNQARHRLNLGGDRQLNRALYHVAITKQRCDPATRAYIARRVAEGKTEREAIRCIKRFLARRVWRLLEHSNIEGSGMCARVPGAGGQGRPQAGAADP